MLFIMKTAAFRTVRIVNKSLIFYQYIITKRALFQDLSLPARGGMKYGKG